MTVQTLNGAIRVQAPLDYSARFELSNVNGAIHVNYPVKQSFPGHGGSASFQTGSGGKTIRVSTVNGSIDFVQKD